MIASNQKPVYIRLDEKYIEYLRYLASVKNINEPNFSYIDLIKETIFNKYPMPECGFDKTNLNLASGIVYNIKEI